MTPNTGGFDLLTITELAAELGVNPRTITQWMVRSLPAPDRRGNKRLYTDMPFPAPSRYAGKSPEWERSKLPQIRQWMAARRGMGAGGGPKPKRTT